MQVHLNFKKSILKTSQMDFEVENEWRKELPDAFHLRSDMTFLHFGQSSLFFNMFVPLHIGQGQFLKFSPHSFFMGLDVFKEKSKKMNLKTRKDD
jgi:hypothetical protein